MSPKTIPCNLKNTVQTRKKTGRSHEIHKGYGFGLHIRSPSKQMGTDMSFTWGGC